MQNIILSKDVPIIIDINTLKSHLRIEHDHEDEYLKTIVKMATEIIENQLSMSIFLKEYQLSYYPTACYEQHTFKLPIHNVVEITSVTQNDKLISYELQRKRNEILLSPTLLDVPVFIIYKAGISDCLQHIPEELKFAVLQITKSIYDCSEENVLELKYVKSIIQRYSCFKL